MTSLFPPFNRRNEFRRQPHYYEAGRGPYVRSQGGPSLNLNFANMTTGAQLAAQGVTFARQSNATYYDSTGKLTYAPNNLVFWSQQFDDGSWVKTNSTVTAPSLSAPNGTNTATKLSETNALGVHSVGSVTLSAVTGVRYTFSIYAKQAERRYLAFNSSSGIFGANEFATFDLQTGTVTQTGSSVIATSITSVGDGWYRCSVTNQATATGTANNAWGATDGPTNGRAYQYTGTTGWGILIWGAQTEAVTYQTTPSTYVATTSAAYYGPRFDYDPVTLQPKGLLIEEARTNLALQSNTFTSGTWLVNNTSTSLSAFLSPDGTAAYRVVANATNTNHNPYQLVAYTASTTYAFSMYAKASGYNWISLYAGGRPETWFDLSTGVTGTVGAGVSASIQNVGNGWYRLTVVNTAAGSSSYATGFRIANGNNVTTFTGDGTSGLLVFGAQLEAGSFATSYIPTAASSVQRVADSASMTGANFSSWYNQSEGTFVFTGDMVGLSSTGAPYLFGVDDGPATSFIGVISRSDAVSANSSGFVTPLTISNPAIVNVPFKVAFAVAANNTAATRDGATPVTRSVYTPPTNVNALRFGNITSSLTPFQTNTHVASFQFYRQRLSNAQLQLLTAPNLAAALALDLDFTTGVLDPRVTFSRTSGATFVDSTGLVTWAPENLILQSNNFNSASYTKNALTSIGLSGTAPFGGSANLITEDTTTAAHAFYGTSFTVIQGLRYLFSIYLKAGTQRYISFRGVANSTGLPWVTLDTQTGQIAGNAAASDVTATPVGDGWFRVSLTSVPNFSGAADCVVAGNPTATPPGVGSGIGTSYLGTSLTWFAAGIQVERVTYQTSPRTYIPTTSAAVYGPRFTFDPVSLQPLGLLIEQDRTNLCLQSQSLSTSPWSSAAAGTASLPVVTASAGTAPDGTNSATRIQFALNGGTTTTDRSRYFQTITTVLASAYTGTIWLKSNTTASFTMILRDANSGNQVTIIVTPTWQRFTVSIPSATASTSFNFEIRGGQSPANSDSADILAWGGQLELGSFATSYIPTTTGSVARAVDYPLMSGSNLNSWLNRTQGTFVVSVQNVQPTNGRILSFENINVLGGNNTSTRGFTSNGTSTLTADLGSGTFAGTVKGAVAYSSGRSLVFNNGTVTTDANSFFGATSNVLYIGTQENTAATMCGTIARLQFYNVRASDSQIQGLTI